MQNETRDVILSVRDLTKVFGTGSQAHTAVNNVTFDVHHGEIIAIVGESGSGKSTLARMLWRLSEPTSGQILLKGQDVLNLKSSRALKPYWRDVQGIFQNPVASFNQFYSVGRVLENTLGLMETKMSKDQKRQNMIDALELVGLNPRDTMNKGAHQLSGGQLQRVMIARSLLVDPEILIADESTSALDASLRVTVLNVLRRLKRELGMSVLFITHDIGQAYYLSDRVFVMYKGSIVEEGDTIAVLENPQHDYTKRLLTDVPRLTSDWSDDVLLTVEELERSIVV